MIKSFERLTFWIIQPDITKKVQKIFPRHFAFKNVVFEKSPIKITGDIGTKPLC